MIKLTKVLLVNEAKIKVKGYDSSRSFPLELLVYRRGDVEGRLRRVQDVFGAAWLGRRLGDALGSGILFSGLGGSKDVLGRSSRRFIAGG